MTSLEIKVHPQLKPDAVESLAWPRHMFDLGQAAEFRAGYNKSPFVVKHNLGRHPLFAIDRLVELCDFLQRQPVEARVLHFTDDAKLTQGWRRTNTMGSKATEALANIQNSHSWVLMKDIQRHPDYADLPERFISDIEQLSGVPMRADISWMDVYIFVASPEMMTPYHIDHECNFLLQIQGEKTTHLFPPADRNVLTEQEIEGYYAGDLNAAQYRDVNEAKAMNVLLRPGIGVHHPPLAPHWVQNGANYSVSLSFLYFLRPFDRRAKVYQVNHLLRRFGMSPTPPDKSRLRDAAKIALLNDFGHRPQRKQDVLRHAYRRLVSPLQFGRGLVSKLPKD